ncbi:hypothetical protein DYY67_1206 [Candidatus Nitrosotalea sp. TS]|nr:hypothetical protein [Candidatus Nitrosotalea sp. TS]
MVLVTCRLTSQSVLICSKNYQQPNRKMMIQKSLTDKKVIFRLI